MREIKVNVDKVKGPLDRYFFNCIGAGRAGEVMRHVAYEQLCTLQQECPFSYIRFHGLFHEEMNVVSRDGQGKLHFHFHYIDQLFDSLLAANIRPIVELGLMPKTMAEDVKTVFWWSMSVSMPRDVAEWYALVEATVHHLSERYGEEEVKQWYFEVWNEPNHPAFFSKHDDINAYFELYDNAARAVKSVCADFRVGGPASAGPRWIDEMIEHCKQNNVPIDFISSHEYCVQGAMFDADGKELLRILPTQHLITSLCRTGDKCHAAGLPFIVTEWSTSYSPRDSIHDHYYSAPFILDVLKHCQGHTDIMSYWVYTDIFEETGPATSLFHGGFGLMTLNSLKKPAYHAFRFLARLGDTEICCDDAAAYACRNENELQLLFWNSKHWDVGEEKNVRYFRKTIVPSELCEAQIELQGLTPEKPYKVTVETIGYRKGDVYDVFVEGEYPTEPTREQTEELLRLSQPAKTEISVRADKSGFIRLTLPQCENQVDLVTVSI